MNEGPSPAMREQMRLEPTMDAAKEYGIQHPDEFGGIYWEHLPAMHVVLFLTGTLDDHLHALRELVPHPDRIDVRQSRYTQRQNQAWLQQIRERLQGREGQRLWVTGWGLERRRIGFVPQVWIWPWSEGRADEVRRVLEPIPVELGAMPHGVPLSTSP